MAEGGRCAGDLCLFRVIHETSHDPIGAGRCRQCLAMIVEGRSEKRTRMAVRRYPAVLLPAGDRVISVSDATVGGPSLAGLGEQKANHPAAQ